MMPLMDMLGYTFIHPALKILGYPLPSSSMKSSSTFIFIFLDSIPLDVPNLLPLPSCAKRMVVRLLLSFSEAFFNLFLGGKWLTFAKRPEKHNPHLFPKVSYKFPFFPDPILFLVGLKPLWEYGQQRPVIIVDGEVEATEQLVENTADSGGSLQQEKLVLHMGSVAGRIKERKLKIRGGSSRPPVKRKLVQGTSSSRSVRQKTSHQIDSSFAVISDDDEGLPNVLELQDATACHLKIYTITPPAWKGHLDNQLDLDLFYLYNYSYARQAVIDNSVNRRAQELLKVVEKMKEECEVLKEREKSKDQEWRESKGASLEAEKVKLECVEASLRPEQENAKRDRAEVISKVVPYVATELVQSDDMGKFVAKLVNASIFYRRCHAFEEVAKIKEPFDITKVKGYRYSYKQEHTKAGNDLATATFPFFTDVVAYPYASIETNESALTPPSLPTHTSPTYVEAPLGYRAAMIRSGVASPPPVQSPRLRRTMIFVRPQTPMAAATKALIATVAAALPLSSPPPSPLTPLSSPIPRFSHRYYLYQHHHYHYLHHNHICYYLLLTVGRMFVDPNLRSIP
ncbi:hypothetical protein Tco_0315972 [Tanacetum coccineum]